ncbi:MAG: acid phosphatase type 7, partial [Gaiellaceae bacterium]|nr:acid phosphatase type 7 [Gaiellaceae bacterium]
MPGTIATLGDTVYDRWSCFAWAPFRKRIRPALGNHDVAVGGFRAYFGLSRTYYAYTLGTWRVIVLDSEDVSDAQRAWLRSELRDHRASCTLAYWHRPRFASSPEASPAMADLWGALYDNGVDLALSGHAHEYERMAPMD